MPDYPSNLGKVQTGKVAMEMVNVIKPTTPESILATRHETMEAMSYANYQRRLLNAGAVYNKAGKLDITHIDPVLVSYAEASFTNDIAKVEGWHNDLQSKLRLIDSEEGFTSTEKDMIGNKILNRADDPIYVPNLSETKPQTEKERLRSFISGAISGTGEETAPVVEQPVESIEETPEEIKPAMVAADLLTTLNTGKKNIQTVNKVKVKTKFMYKNLAEQLNYSAGIWHKQSQADIASYHARGGFEKGEPFIPKGTIIGKGSNMEITPDELKSISGLGENELAEVKAILFSGNQEAIRALVSKIKERASSKGKK